MQIVNIHSIYYIEWNFYNGIFFLLKRQQWYNETERMFFFSCVPKQQLNINFQIMLMIWDFLLVLFKHHHIIVAFSSRLCWRCGIFKTLDCMVQPSNKHESLKFVLLIKRILSILQANRMPKHFNGNVPCKQNVLHIEYYVVQDC